tara:strand:- start:28582 stop:30633 length:2052 start_codon:yes stop_codon:yes gene_type:complete
MEAIPLYSTDPTDSEIRLSMQDRERLQDGSHDHPDPNDFPEDESTYTQFSNAFRYICGIDAEESNPYTDEPWTEDEMVLAMNETRAFLKTDLVNILNLVGVAADIMAALFYVELEEFSVEEMEAFCKLFQLDIELDGSAPEEENRQIVSDLIIEFKYWMLDRLRMWKWREEVLFNRAGSEFRFYPGLEIIDFETASDILEEGPTTYYSRVGSTTREWLITNFNYFDLAHMAGVLGLGTLTPLVLTTHTNKTIISDIILRMLDELSDIDSRAFLTPLGPVLSINREESEVPYNFNVMNPINNDIDLKKSELYPVANSYGISLKVCGLGLYDDTGIKEEDDLNLEKPVFAVAEELMEQYMSKQFFTGVEYTRDHFVAAENMKTLSGNSIQDFEKGQVLFYGVGDGLSTYFVYELKELEAIFRETQDYFDPASIARNPENIRKWKRFSPSCIRRLRNVILPRLRPMLRKQEPEWYRILVDLEMTILNIEEDKAIRIQNEPSFGKSYQLEIINTIRHHVNEDPMVRDGVADFVCFLFNLGSQFSDWDENFAEISPDKLTEIQMQTLDRKGEWHYLDPRQSTDLQDKIVMMLTFEVEKYINVKTKAGNLGPYLRRLALIKFYDDRYCTEYEDELNTLDNRFRLMVNATSLGYLDFIRTTGNWLMATSTFYQRMLLNGFDATTMIKMDI